jgi:hypothetical protein
LEQKQLNKPRPEQHEKEKTNYEHFRSGGMRHAAEKFCVEINGERTRMTHLAIIK